MNGYQYMVERNRLMFELEQKLAGLDHLSEAERQAETRRLQAEFDGRLAQLYAQVSAEFPGERRKKARPLADPR